MRIKIHLEGSGILPFDYHYHLGAAMYRFKRIANEELSTALHYSYGVKLFTFSEIMVPRRKKLREGIKILDNYAYLVYSSPHTEYVEAIATGLLSDPVLRVGKLKFEITEVEVLEEPGVDWGNVHFRTLSPIVVTRRNSAGKKEPVMPTENDWYQIMENNIKHGYEEYYGESLSGRIYIDPVSKTGLKANKYLFPKGKGGAVHAVRGHFIFRGPPELIKFAYEAGVGERGAFGFGCMDVVQDNKYHKNNTSQIRLNR